MTHDRWSQKVTLVSTAVVALFFASSQAFASCSAPTGGPVPLAQHVIVVMEENTSFSSINSTNTPWLFNEASTKGGFSGQNCYNSVSGGGSLNEYLMLSGGSMFTEAPFNCTGNDCSPTSPPPDPNIFSLANNQPLTWKVYAQSYQNSGAYLEAPDRGPSCSTPNHYYRRHNAAPWYNEVLTNTLGSEGGVVDFEQFYIDVANGTLPRYAIIAPDGQYDAHDGCGLNLMDNFLKNNLNGTGIYTDLLTLPDFQSGGSGLLIVTFDNAGGDANGNVFTTLIGPNVKQGYVSTFSYSHQDVLKTTLEALGISSYPCSPSSNCPSAVEMADFFSPTAGSVVINSPANNSFQGPSVLVNAAAKELGRSISRLEVWDVFNNTGTKLGDVFADNVNQVYSVSGNGPHQLIVQDIDNNNNLIRKSVTNYTVTDSDGVTVVSPPSGSTQASLFPLQAYAVESTADIDHLEVWCDGQKVGDSPKGSTITQWFSNWKADDTTVDHNFPMLAPGSHQVTVEDVGSGSTVLHSVTFPITIVAQNNVYVNSPANNSAQSSSVYVNAYAYELANSTQQVDHMEVWDVFNGKSTKLSDSPLGYGSTSLFVNQTFNNLPAGPHTLIIQDLAPGGSVPLHKTSVNITVN